MLHFISITILLRELTNQTILTSGDNDDDCDAHYTCGGIRIFLDVIASLSTYPGQWVSQSVRFWAKFMKIQIYWQQSINLYRQINITTHVLKDPDIMMPKSIKIISFENISFFDISNIYHMIC